MSNIFSSKVAPIFIKSSSNEAEKKKAKANRSALFATEGGIEGQELTSGQTKKRDTILGN